MYSVFSSENKEIQHYQKQAIDGIHNLLNSVEKRKNALLYFSMGKGKTMIGTQIAKNITDGENQCDSVMVIATPSTHKDWNYYLKTYVSVPFLVVSHQWVTRNTDIAKKAIGNMLLIVDEIHLSANRGKAGTKAVTALMSRSFGSVLMSGTPFRNKEERLFTVHDWLFGNAENYEKWLHQYCNTEPDRFSYYPNFVSFKSGSIEDYLMHIDSGLHRKIYIEKEDMKYKVTYKHLPIINPQYEILEKYSVYGSDRIVVANSLMRKLRYLSYLKYCNRLEIDEQNDSCILCNPREDVRDIIKKYAGRNPIIYAQSAKVARLYNDLFPDSLYIDGKTTKKNKHEIFSEYKKGGKLLFATDSVSTGTDGAQEATNCIIILYDTTDDTSRDQLIGRIAGGFRNKGDAEIVFVNIS